MPIDSPMLFSRLSRLASRQGENFLTESFVAVLLTLARYEPEIGSNLLARLTGGALDISVEEIAELQISTQVTTDSGRPDIEIRHRRKLAFVEVKESASLGVQQSQRYHRDLLACDAEVRCLTLLSKFRVSADDTECCCDVLVRWCQVSSWLCEWVRKSKWRSDIGRFVVAEFIEFMHFKGLAIMKVGEQLASGGQSLYVLIELLKEAALRCGRTPSRITISDGWIGMHLEQKRFSLGIAFGESRAQFVTYKFDLDVEAAKNQPIGEVYDTEYPRETGPYRWWHFVELAENDGEFFRLDAAEQLARLEAFTHICLDTAAKIEFKANNSVKTARTELTPEDGRIE